jgi:Adenine specific DNA methylase Mod
MPPKTETSDMPEKLDLRSHDVAGDKMQELLRLFPEIRTEGGKIDFERLKLALGEAVDVGRERYGLTWPGKADCFKTIQAPSLATLRPAVDESVRFDTSENLIVEGDNLEVLKLLQKSYLGKVKMIYIDPPYNTGNDFIYPDNYAESLQTYLEYTGQVDAQGKKFSTNTDTDGRFHSKWLNMMYPRLYLARNLLREDGVVFISCDDGEVHNLRHLLNEVFGQENFVACIAWEKRYTRSNNAKGFYSLKDSIVAYRRSDAVSVIREARTEKADDGYKNADGDHRGRWMTSSYVNPALKAERPNLVYDIQGPQGRVVTHPTNAWKYGPQEHRRHVSENLLWWGSDGMALYPRLKMFLSEAGEMVPIDLWSHEDAGTTDQGGGRSRNCLVAKAFSTIPSRRAS